MTETNSNTQQQQQIETTIQCQSRNNNQNQSHSHRYIALYKPALTLCTFHEDDEYRIEKKGRRDTLADIDDGKLSQITGLHAVGRLDRETEGLLLLTTDGKFTAEVHEKCHKKYWVLVEGNPTKVAIQKMGLGGLQIRGSITRPPISVKVLTSSSSLTSSDNDNDSEIEAVTPTTTMEEEEISMMLPKPIQRFDRKGTWMEIILDEGKNRQIRRIMKHAGHKVIRLCRVGIGCLDCTNNMKLQPGEWKSFEKDFLFNGNSSNDGD